MRLHQNQIWQQGDNYLCIVHLERLSVTYKNKPDPKANEGTTHEVTKKEFCRLIKGAELVSGLPAKN